ncbi:MAG: HD domain-containing protein [Candidatus Micrarchaeota archaeon]
MGKNEREISRIADFIFEAGMLKDTPRSGWLTIGIKNPESVAEHSFRTGIIGLILAKLEGANEEKVMKLCLLHDLEETRLGDLHSVNKLYLKETKSACEDVFLGLFCEKEFIGLAKELKGMKTKEAVIAKDADRLEMVFQAKEYSDQGKKYIEDWIKSGMSGLSTKSAKRIAKEALLRDSRKWLFGIK